VMLSEEDEQQSHRHEGARVVEEHHARLRDIDRLHGDHLALQQPLEHGRDHVADHVRHADGGEGHVRRRIQHDAAHDVHERGDDPESHLDALTREPLDHHSHDWRDVAHHDDRAHRRMVESEHRRGKHQREEYGDGKRPAQHVA